jgi:transposase
MNFDLLYGKINVLRYGITIHTTDIFGRRGIRSILEESSKLPAIDRIVLSDLIERISGLKERERMLEDQMAAVCEGITSVRLLMAIPGTNVYSASVILSEIDNISIFQGKVP